MKREFGTQPGILVLEASHEGDAVADALLVHLQLRGSSLVFGRAALKENAELADLVKRAGFAGLPVEQITIENVYTETQSSIFSKSTHASYFLRILVTDLERIQTIMDAITETKNCTILLTQWQFRNLEEQRQEWIRACLRTIRGRAKIIADGLSTSVLGIERLTERLEKEEDSHWKTFMPVTQTGGADRKSREGEVSYGFETSHRQRMIQHVVAELRVGSGSGVSSGEGS